MSSREQVVAAARAELSSGRFLQLLQERVAYRTLSQGGGDRERAEAYLREAIIPELSAMGFDAQVYENPVSANHPLLVGRRVEDPSLPTVLLYGHGDVQFAHADQWSAGLDPWVLQRVGDRVYGRGTADNKGQHLVNSQALRCAIDARGGRLGFNVTIVMETAEEAGSVGFEEFVRAHRDDLLAADLFLGSDGPRVAAEVPTVFLGSRGTAQFWLRLNLRDRGYHSGNWGGKLRNPATTLCAAISSLVDGDGVIRIPALRPPVLDPDVKAAIDRLPVIVEEGSPEIDPTWGEPGLTPTEKTLGWNGLEVLALDAGDPAAPVGAIPGHAAALLQLRYVVGTDVSHLQEDVGAYLASQGFRGIEIEVDPHGDEATRLDVNAAPVRACVDSIRATTGKDPAVLPNFGGALPNATFANTLGLPTLWVPHSYPGCNQHAPDEHNLASLLEEGLGVMAGIFWDLGEAPERWFARK